MLWLRSLLFATFQWLFTPVFCVLLLLTYPLPPQRRYPIITIWAKTMLWWLRITCGINYRVIGANNIPQQPCVVMCKHQSAWETLALQKILPPQVWVMKRELLLVPFFGWGLAMSSPIAIDRTAGRDALKQLVAQGQDRLNKGFFVVVFPEGTRIAPGKRGKYHIGGAWLATHTNTLALPIAHNAGEFWGKNSFLKRPGTITVSIGTPITTTGLKADELNRRVEEWIEAELPRLKQYA
ncbi:MAG TPA: lysophospholipid acyltransferase family protein [Methylophilaceae bacterium]